LARLLYGGRISLAVGLAAMSVAVVVGTFVGAVAGMSRGWLGSGLMCRPVLVFATASAFTARDLSVPRRTEVCFGVEVGVVVLIVLVIGGLRWMHVARLVRAQFLSLREKEFVEAARASGASPIRQVVRHERGSDVPQPVGRYLQAYHHPGIFLGSPRICGQNSASD
jgi:peptide/nickel transport system permease protein